jgi:hypothetical protein
MSPDDRPLPVSAALALVAAGCGGSHPARVTSAGAGLRSCAFQQLGKGWYLSASKAIRCVDAERIFRRYFSSAGCNEAKDAGTCRVRAYRCHYTFSDDVGRARCTSKAGVIAFRSVV